MNKNRRFIPPRQQMLEFARDGTWSGLPKSARRECQTIVAQLLADVIRQEIELNRRTEDERQDQS